MIHRRYMIPTLLLAVGMGMPTAARSQDGPLKAETLEEAPPEALEAAIREGLDANAIRVLDADGEPLADIWLRRDLAAAGAPEGPKGSILFPSLKTGQLVGAVRLGQKGYDYRDQQIAEGVYTLRYGLLPVDGDHLGVSQYRDYLLLVPTGEEADLEPIDQDTLNVLSADASMTNHPAVFLLDAAPPGAPDGPGTAHDEANDRHGVVLTLPLKVEGQEDPVPLKFQLILVGLGPA